MDNHEEIKKSKNKLFDNLEGNHNFLKNKTRTTEWNLLF